MTDKTIKDIEELFDMKVKWDLRDEVIFHNDITNLRLIITKEYVSYKYIVNSGSYVNKSLPTKKMIKLAKLLENDK